MSKLISFLKKCKLPILWTIGYMFAAWAIFHILFNFEIFNSAHWIRASHAHLRGLGGLTFCLIVATLIPLYIATTSIVIRTQQPLLALPMPKFIAKIMEKIFPMKNKQSDEQSETESEPLQPTNEEIDSFPSEMRGAFLRARTHPDRIKTPICSVCSITPNVYPNNASPESQPCNIESDIPLPPDFDTDDTFTTTPPEQHSAPVFQDINFYDDDLSNDTNSEPENQNPVTEHLKKTNREFNVLDNGFILTNDKIIATHTDSDFWIMDEPVWFASGKTRESPINALREGATQHNVQAILYIGSTNIMNFAEKRAEWESTGIHVITKIEDL